MDLKTKLYQMFILGTEGDGYIQALENGLGGIIFFTKDIQSKDQFKNLISDIKSKALIVNLPRKLEYLAISNNFIS